MDNDKVNLSYVFLLFFFVIAFIFFFIELQVLLTPEPDNLSLYLKIWKIKDWLIVGILIFGPNLGNSFGQNSGNSFGRYSGSNIKFGPDSGKVFGHNSGNEIKFGQHSGKVFGHNSDKNIFIGILGTLSGIFSAILATAFCSSCLAVLFSLLGISFSTGIFFLKYKFLIFLLSTILLLIFLHFQSKIIIEKCQC